ncbi:MAG: hypothetical protein EG826_11125 [Deltaproteobacteria bacterium]|nr:hypothetical protein [Deltaproteobacteria bacterium]
MKRLWVVLLALGLITVFSTTVFALDVKFSGEYYAAGMYLDRASLVKDADPLSGTSTAFYFQRLRVRTDFIVSTGLTLVTRFDAMERAWGAARSAPGTTQAADSAGTRAENENIAFDWAYLEYKSPIGIFSAGYMNDGSTGTFFGDSYSPKGRIKYSYTFAPVTINLAYTKEKEASSMATGVTNVVDADNNKYGVEGIFTWKTGRAGMQINYYNFANARTAALPYKRKYLLFTPYVFAKFGPVALQAEFNYLTGDDKFENNGVTPDVKLQNYTGYVDATADFGMFYAGGSVAFVSGDDPATTDKNEGGIINGGRDWKPCLIMWNYDRTNWAGALTGWNGTNQDTAMANGWFAQGRVGVRPVAALDIMASVSWAHADKTPSATWQSRDYGYEVDLTATYKITNNLSYMLGGGYLFAGDWYKGINAGGTNQIQNDFMVINKLTLTF